MVDGASRGRAREIERLEGNPIEMVELVVGAITALIIAVMVIFLVLVAVNVALVVALRSHIPQTPVRTPST
jgi:hypothetical protein